MQNPIFTHASIAASGSYTAPGTIPLVRARTLSITVCMTFGASINADATVDLFYSPDGSNWDTIAYTSWSIAYTAGATVQKTVNVDPPEHGFLKIKVTNGSSADVITAVQAWYSIQSHPDGVVQEHGSILKDTGE